MFQRIRRRFKDMGTLKVLCEGAERHALQDGQQEPGAEHFLLAALDLPDGAARRTFARLAADPDRLREAIAQQHGDALRGIGIDPSLVALMEEGGAPPQAARAIYSTKPSGQAVIHELAAQREHDKDAPLSGAHVVLAVASVRQGASVRALARLGIGLDAIGAAARDELQSAQRQ
jgi:ATP-dependent Clp protease ATP-binding subunit ClpA